MSVFSNIEPNRILYKGKHFFLIKDGFPVSPGHILIISNKEKLDYFELETNERIELTELIDIAKEIIENPPVVIEKVIETVIETVHVTDPKLVEELQILKEENEKLARENTAAVRAKEEQILKRSIRYIQNHRLWQKRDVVIDAAPVLNVTSVLVFVRRNRLLPFLKTILKIQISLVRLNWYAPPQNFIPQ